MSNHPYFTENQAMISDSLSLSPEQHSALAGLFKQLGDEGRLKLVLACMVEPQPVALLSELAGVSQSLTSHHLKRLRDDRILRACRQGKQVLYTLDDDHIRCVLNDLIQHIRE